MIVNYFGDGCFRLQSGETSLLVDPNNNRLKADVVLKTLTLGNLALIPANEISFPGEYETKNIRIQGWPLNEESTEKFLKTVYLVNWEEINIVFLGHLAKPLAPELLEEISEVDVLFTPAGAEHFLPVEAAARLIKKLEPAVVIPGFYKKPDEFLKALGQKAEPQEKFVFKKKDLADLSTKIVILKSSR